MSIRQGNNIIAGRIESAGGLEICDIGMSLYVDESKGLRRRLNGSILAINKNTQAFYERLKEIATLYPQILTDEDGWQSTVLLSQYKQCGRFVINEDEQTIRLPKVVNVKGLQDLGMLGSYVTQTMDTTVSGSTGEAGISGTTGGTGTSGTVSTCGDMGGWTSGVGDHAHTYAFGSLVAWNATTGAGAHSHSIGTNNHNHTFTTGAHTHTFNAGNHSHTMSANIQLSDDEAILYPYFIQIATGQETQVDIVNEIELNNPYSLGDSKYSPNELDNISWLASKNQWNSGDTYPAFYAWILEQVNKGTENFKATIYHEFIEPSTSYTFWISTKTPKVGQAVYGFGNFHNYPYMRCCGKIESASADTFTFTVNFASSSLHNQKYTVNYNRTIEGLSDWVSDYDFVVNTTDRTFRLPLLDGSEDLQGTEYISLETAIQLRTNTAYAYTAPYNGFFLFNARATDIGQFLGCYSDGVYKHVECWSTRNGEMIVPPVLSIKKGYTITDIRTNFNPADYVVRFIKAVGNGTLYYYVGETVQNANLIDIGRITENYTTRDFAQSASFPSNRFIDLTLGASGSSYTAPANGWFSVGGNDLETGNDFKYVMRIESTRFGVSSTNPSGTTGWLAGVLPVKKGDTVNIYYNGLTSTGVFFKFVYAEGSN